MKITKDVPSKKQTTEELTLDIVKGITGIAAEFITPNNSPGTLLLKVDSNGEIDPLHQQMILEFLNRAFGPVKIKPTVEGVELSWR